MLCTLKVPLLWLLHKRSPNAPSNLSTTSTHSHVTSFVAWKRVTGNLPDLWTTNGRIASSRFRARSCRRSHRRPAVTRAMPDMSRRYGRSWAVPSGCTHRVSCARFQGGLTRVFQFDLVCLQQWSSISSRCPCCRAEYNTITSYKACAMVIHFS